MTTMKRAIETSLIAPARQERSRRSLDKIATAAEMILRRDGAEGFSVGAVAEVSGISIGGIYARVKGKRELFELVKLNSTTRVTNRVQARLKASFSMADEVVDAFISALCDEFSRDEKLHSALFSPGISAVIDNSAGDENRRRSVGYFVEALIAAEPDFTRFESRDVELVAELPISHIMRSLTSGAHDLDWDWMERSLQWTSRLHVRALLEAGVVPAPST